MENNKDKNKRQPQRIEHLVPQTLSETFSVLTRRQKATPTLTKFGDKKTFLATFTPQLQLTMCTDEKECILGDYPTMAEMKAHGENFPAAWLVPQIFELSEYCGARDKIPPLVLQQLAQIIAKEFYYLKVSEMMLFFYRFKLGTYGRFFGTIDPLIITQSLREFLKERFVVIDTAEQEKARQMRKEWQKDAISYEQWIREKAEAAKKEEEGEE